MAEARGSEPLGFGKETKPLAEARGSEPLGFGKETKPLAQAQGSDAPRVRQGNETPGSSQGP
jgi:hypothetical protein